MRKVDQDQSQRKEPIWLVMDSTVERNKYKPESSNPKGKLWEIDFQNMEHDIFFP